LLCEAFKVQAGIDIARAYRGGGESLTDFPPASSIHADPNTMPHITSGKAKRWPSSTASAGRI
jgi:hypothetical protein